MKWYRPGNPPPGTAKTIVYVSPLPPPAGGISTWTRILVTNGLPDDYAPVIVNTSKGEAHSVFQRGSLGSELRRAASVIRRFLWVVLRERPVFVHVNVDALALGFYRDALCAALGKMLGLPVAIHYRGLVARLADEPGCRFRRWAFRRSARLVDLNLVLNKPCLDFLEREVGGRSQIALVPNFYDDRTCPERRVEQRAPGEALRVVFVGALTRAKGVAEVLETASRLPTVDFHLFGQAYPESRALLASLPPNVQLHGEVPHETVLAEMAHSHILLFPTRHGEGFPNAVCEAMAMGLAVVSTAVGAIPEMIEEGRGGVLVDPVPEALAEAVRGLLLEDERRVAMGAFNQGKSRRLYAYDRVVSLLVSLYEGCLPGSQR